MKRASPFYGIPQRYLRQAMFVALFLLYGTTCWAFLDRTRPDDEVENKIFRGMGIGFGAVETPTGWQPMIDVNILDYHGKHGFLNIESRFALGSGDTMMSKKDGKMSFLDWKLLFGFGPPYLQVGTGLIGMSTDLATEDIKLINYPGITGVEVDNTRKTEYTTSVIPLLIKITPLRTERHYLTASAMVYGWAAGGSSADIPIKQFGVDGYISVKGEGGRISNYADATYYYRLTSDKQKKGWLFYTKGFYEKGDAKNLTDLGVPTDLNTTNTSAYVPDLEWEIKGLYLGIALEL